MNQSIHNNIKTPSWSDNQTTPYKSSSDNNDSVCGLCQGFSCVSCMLKSSNPSKKRKITDFNQISSQQPTQQTSFSPLQNNSNNNYVGYIDLTDPPARNTRSALKRSHSDNASQSSSSENQNSTSYQSPKTKTEQKFSAKKLSDSGTTNNSKMNVQNLISNEDETPKPLTKSQGATNEKGLLCPVCSKIVPTATNEASLNLHIDECLSMKLLEEENTVPKNAPAPSLQADPSNLQAAFGFDPMLLQEIQKQLSSNQHPMPKPAAKPVHKDYVKHHDDEDDEDNEDWDDDIYHNYNEDEDQDEEHLGKVRCPYMDCGVGYIATEEFGKHVLQSHKGGYQKHLCPICVCVFVLFGLMKKAPNSTYSVHKGTNLYRHVQQFHAFFAFNAPSESTTKPQAKPQPKPQHIDFVEEILMKDMDTECCICFEQFETGNTVARLPCLCIFHKTCVVRWFEKEKRCPVHEEIPQQ